MAPNTDAPNDDAPNAADYDTDYPYSMRNRKHKKNNITTNTDALDNDTTNADDDYAASSDSLILYFSLKHKIDPSHCLNIKK